MGNRLMDAFALPAAEQEDKKEKMAEETAPAEGRTASGKTNEPVLERPGRPTFRDRNRAMKTTSMRFYNEDFVYCRLRMKELGKSQQSVSGFLAWLIEKDRENHPELATKARRIAEIEKEL